MYIHVCIYIYIYTCYILAICNKSDIHLYIFIIIYIYIYTYYTYTPGLSERLRIRMAAGNVFARVASHKPSKHINTLNINDIILVGVIYNMYIYIYIYSRYI